MYKKALGLIVAIFLILISGANATQLEIETNILEDITTFDYKFEFDDESSMSSFSLLIPPDATLEKINSSGLEQEISYTRVGGYYIIEPEQVKNSTFEMRFESDETSRELLRTGIFRHYVNFNFMIDEFKYKLNADSGFEELKEVYPEDFQIDQDGYLVWEDQNVDSTKLYFIDFGDTMPGELENEYLMLMIVSAGLLVVALGLYFSYKRYSRKSNKNETNKEKNNKKTENVQIQETTIISDQETNDEILYENYEENLVDKNKEKKDPFKEIIDKYLTENEKEVVEVVRDNPGISQYDILNFLPHLTKSNLSKIISKLNNKKYLNRIKVGKVNKIYLGEKLENLE